MVFDQTPITPQQTPLITIEPRLHTVGLSIGERGSGKSTRTFGMLLDVIEGDLARGILSRNCLIVDFNNEYGEFIYRKSGYEPVKFLIKTIPLAAVPEFSEYKGRATIRRIVPFRPDGSVFNLKELQELLHASLALFGNGVVLLEDLGKYTSANLSQELVMAVLANRHKNIEIIVNYQNIGITPPKFFDEANWIRLHYEGTAIKRVKEKILDYHIYIQICKEIISKRYFAGDKKFALYYKKGGKIIEGEFTKQEAEEAILRVVSNNRNEMLSPKINELNRNGKHVYTRTGAMDAVMEEYMKSIRCNDYRGS